MAHRLHPGAPLFPTVTPAACSRSLLWAHPAALRRARPLCVPSAAASAAGPTAAESAAAPTTLARTPGRFASALDPATYTTMLEQLQDWAEQYGSCYIPGSAADPRAPALAAWLKALRGARRAGTLSQQQQQQLEELGVAWKPNVVRPAAAEGWAGMLGCIGQHTWCARRGSPLVIVGGGDCPYIMSIIQVLHAWNVQVS
jgi:hypothetical protein